MVHEQMQFHLCAYEKYDHRCVGLHETTIIKSSHTDFLHQVSPKIRH